MESKENSPLNQPPYLCIATQTILKTVALFWSGVKELEHKLFPCINFLHIDEFDSSVLCGIFHCR